MAVEQAAADFGRIERLKQTVLAMPMAKFLGLHFTQIASGAVEPKIPYRNELSFRPGKLRATAIFAVADFAEVAAEGCFKLSRRLPL
jgi:acyl-coenzyme A thioesterase PaaI-like protein